VLNRLKKHRENVILIKNLAEMIKELEISLLDPRISRLNLHINATGRKIELFECIDKVETLRTHYNTILSDLMNEQIQLEKFIGDLTPVEQCIFRNYYFISMTWEEVADSVNLSTMQIWRIHKRVIECYSQDKL
jgi:DNA-directed RNA polymerase specialized sigma subunit